MSQKYLFNGGTGDFERLPGTENDKLTLGEQMLLKPELNLMNTELNLNQPTLPGMNNLPKTKTVPTYSQYVDKEQRLYEKLKVPGYETPEKSKASYKKLKKMKEPVDYDDWKNDNDRWRKHLADTIAEGKQTIFYNKDRGKWLDKWGQERTPEEALKEQNDIDETYKTLAPNITKPDPLPKNLGPLSMKSDTRTPNQKKKDKWEYDKGKWKKKENWNYEPWANDKVERIKPFVADDRSTYPSNYTKDQKIEFNKYQKEKMKPSYVPTWDLLKQTASTHEEKQDIRNIINREYDRNGMKGLTPDEIKYIDKDKIKPVQVFTNELGALEDSIENKPRPQYNTTEDVSETVKKLAKESYERDLKEFDKQWGKGGIPTLVRDKI